MAGKCFSSPLQAEHLQGFALTIRLTLPSSPQGLATGDGWEWPCSVPRPRHGMWKLCKLTTDLSKELGTNSTLFGVLVREAILCCLGCLLDIWKSGFYLKPTESECLEKDVPFKQNRW